MTPTLSFFFEKSPLGFAHLEIVTPLTHSSPEFVFLEVNPAFEAITGLQKDEITGKSVYQVINGSETFNMVFQSILQKISITQVSTKFEHHMPQFGKWYRVNLNPIDEAHIILIMSDITDQKLKEEELQRTKARLSSIIENSLISVWAMDKNYDLLYLNDNFKNAFYETFRVWLKPGSNLLKALPLRIADEWKARYDTVLNGESIDIVDEIVEPTVTVYIEVTGNPIIQDRKVVGATFFGKDITARKLMSKELSFQVDFNEKLLAGMPDAVIQTEIDGTITYINQQVLINYPFMKREDLIGWNIMSFVTPDDLLRVKEDFKKMFEKAQGVQEYSLQFGTEHLVVCEINGDIIRDEKGNPISLIFVVRDITQRRRDEKILEKEKIRFQNLFEHSPVATWLEDFTELIKWFDVLRKQGVKDIRQYMLDNPDLLKKALSMIRVKDVNQAAVIQNGAVSKAHLIEGLPQLFSDKTFISFLNELELLWSGEKEYIFESQSLRFDNSSIFVKIRTMVPEINGQPDYSQVIITATDMTERKKAESVIRERESELRKLSLAVEQSPASVVITDLEGNIEYVNKKFTEITGYSFEEAIGQNPRVLKSEMQPIEYYRDLWCTIKSGKEWRGEFYNIKKNGDKFWESALITPVRDETGNVVHFLAIKEDITDRKIAQQALEEQSQLQLILMEISNTFINLPVDMADVVINQSLERIGKFTGSDRAYIFMFDYEKGLASNTYEWCETGISAQIDSLQNIPMSAMPELIEANMKGEPLHVPDVSVLDENCDFSKLLVPQGIKSLLSIPLMSRDVCIGFVGFDAVTTPRNFSANDNKLLELFAMMMVNLFNRIGDQKKLNMAVEMANAASKAKSEFLANLSHEIRTPLNGVIGFTELLKSTILTAVQKQYVDNANVSGHALLGIINDILDFSKIEAGKLRLEKIKTDMAELLESSIDIVKFNAGRKNLELLLDIDPQMPDFAVVDPIRLKQILSNLLGNAIKFTEKGEVELKIEFQPISENYGNFKFSVRDTGIGITAEQKEKLFLAFSQADSSTTRKFGGTGLGLIISDMIAGQMDSKIYVDSVPGEGTTFWFEIKTATEPGNKNKYLSLEKLKSCLIVDDNEQNRLILEHKLANWEVECTSCVSGIEALQLLKTSPKKFDLIICDFNMPEIDGLDTIRKIREIPAFDAIQQPIILLHSSSDDAEMHRKCNEAGVRFMLTKPVKSNDLYAYLCQVHSGRLSATDVIETTVNQEIKDKNILSNAAINIMIAEDVNLNMVMIKAIFSRFLPNANFIEAVNGRVAVQKFEETEIDIVFMDVQMPEMDGLEATRKLREMEVSTGKHIPVIALTAGAFKEEQIRCLAAGMDDFLTKPVEPVKIKNALIKHLKL